MGDGLHVSCAHFCASSRISSEIMFAKSSTLSSTAAVFTPQGATVASTEYMQQQYYGSSSYECQDSYGMASYSYGYDNSYGTLAETSF
eukprot:Skav200754  [mRNA]  locus=scaffold1117:452700:457454:+ [translate_table: standard]